ncbi:MAG: [FeFe] hydrogenase H-cluster radical SAM maturase HydE [Chitinivibrionales bacterium]|nr:[FeFe] hydrogenase H-cluster radical SAM maturase HydE [Chitinivibrionales bacterium]
MNTSIQEIERIISGPIETRDDIITLLSERSEAGIEAIRRAAEATLLSCCGDTVYFRGLIEFSNICTMDCYYCGIRKSNQKPQRYCLEKEEILQACLWCAEQKYGSVVLQSGERTDELFVDFIVDCVSTIKKTTISPHLPNGLAITLCVGEQSEKSYQRFFAAGAHRYLLRIETTNQGLFTKIHPPQQSLESRRKCLNMLRSIGFQVGTGVMIGLPGQTIPMLADDILFFRDQDVDMIGMGPYIAHTDTPLGSDPSTRGWTRTDSLTTALLMIAGCRLVLRDVNIAATTALQAIDPQGRERGLRFGANVIMPQLTPGRYRNEYLLYEGKPCIDEDAQHCSGCIAARVNSVGRHIGVNTWGNSPHFQKRSGKNASADHPEPAC